MTYQERERFSNWLLDRHIVDETRDGIMAEHDRLTTLNAQLLEALKVEPWDGEEQADGKIIFFCHWCGANQKYGHSNNCSREAAIRAAEELNNVK